MTEIIEGHGISCEEKGGNPVSGQTQATKCQQMCSVIFFICIDI